MLFIYITFIYFFGQSSGLSLRCRFYSHCSFTETCTRKRVLGNVELVTNTQM